ncbi:hypothetical protein JTY60_02135 [symbiont of Argiope bruennichi]|uniref:hypothetical protein n=1 Tax=symbiont of Argiope bruennichi TaxID=2810479 RepID=UPI003DA21229
MIVSFIKNLKKHFFSYFKVLFFIFLCLFSIFFGWFFKDIFLKNKTINNNNYLKDKVTLANKKVVDYFANNKGFQTEINNISNNYFPYYYVYDNKEKFIFYSLKWLLKNYKFDKHFVVTDTDVYFNFNGTWNFKEIEDIFQNNKSVANIAIQIFSQLLPVQFRSLLTYDNILVFLNDLATSFPGDYVLNYEKSNNLYEDYNNLLHTNFIYQITYMNDNLMIKVDDFFNFFPSTINLSNNGKKIILNEFFKTLITSFFSYNFYIDGLKIDYNSIRFNFSFGKR